jgi:hypothetical protein
MPAGNLGVDPFQNQHLAIEADHLAIVCAGRRGPGADIGFAFDAPLEDHFLRLWVVMSEHDDVSVRSTVNTVSQRTLIPRCCFGATAILVAVIGCEPPSVLRFPLAASWPASR